jgi:myo-inositol-1(or 4)-monophosphatase
VRHISTILSILLTIQNKASSIISRDFRELKLLQSSVNPTIDFAAHTQQKLESLLANELRKARPSFTIFSKHNGKIDGEDDKYCWLINSLSDLNNFSHAQPFTTLSIALAEGIENPEAIAALIYIIATGEIIFAEKGKGAWLENNDGSANSQRLRVSTRKDNLIVHTTSISNKFQSVNYGSPEASLAYLASGRLDAVMMEEVDYLDVAAALLLVQEAGGMISKDISKNKKLSIVATNTYCDKFLKI